MLVGLHSLLEVLGNKSGRSKFLAVGRLRSLLPGQMSARARPHRPEGALATSCVWARVSEYSNGAQILTRRLALVSPFHSISLSSSFPALFSFSFVFCNKGSCDYTVTVCITTIGQSPYFKISYLVPLTSSAASVVPRLVLD